MIIDGRALAEKRKEEVRVLLAGLPPLTLGVVVSGGDAVTASYIRIKKRIATELGVTVKEIDLDTAAFDNVDGIVVQLPLPPGMDLEAALALVPPEKDVDGLTPGARVMPPVAAAMRYVLAEHHTSIVGKKVVVVGQGRLVGRPAARFFTDAGAEVTVLDKGDDIGAATKSADIVALGAGVPHLLRPDMIKEGVVVLDAGTSESGGLIVGDADPVCADKCALFTPVPGGLGPIAVVEIFANLAALKKMT